MEALDPVSLAERLRWEQQDYWLHVEAGSALEKYPAKQHARRVVEKLGVADGLVYLPGQRVRFNDDSDMPAPFRQKRYFYYLSGCNEPNCAVTYDIQADTLTLFIPKVDISRVIWNGRGSTPAEALDKYDIDAVLFTDDLEAYLDQWYYSSKLYILHPADFLGTPGDTKHVDYESLRPAMNLARIIKDDHEIKLIRKANDISSQAHKEVLANIQRFKNEAQVEGLFLNVCISNQAKEQAYDPIAASGPNAGTLHYDDNNEDFEDRQLICLDAGCEWQLYASDITRTFPLSGNWPSQEAKNTYRLVQRMQETCIERLAPGVRYFDLHILAHQIAIDGLLSLGILHNGTREEIYKAGTSRCFFPHGLGHYVGLEVHDVTQAHLMSSMSDNPLYKQAPSLYPENFHLPVYDSTLCMSPTDAQSGHLEEGMVVTVEPGIYFSVEALTRFYLPSPIHSKYINAKVVQKYLPVGGVRIEDDILITSKSYENLTTAPKGEAMLEIIRSQNAQWPFVTDSADSGPVRASRVERKSIEKEDELLRRAPGISQHSPEPILRPIERASTLPPERKDRKSVDFEPFDGLSLFSNFKRASTIDVASRVAHLGSNARPTLAEFYPRTTICGVNSNTLQHIYMDFAATTYDPEPMPQTVGRPKCLKCSILHQTVERLRTNLSISENRSVKAEKKVEEKPSIEPTPIEKPREMTQRPRSFVSSSSRGQTRQAPTESHRMTAALDSNANANVSPERAQLQESIARLQLALLASNNPYTGKNTTAAEQAASAIITNPRQGGSQRVPQTVPNRRERRPARIEQIRRENPARLRQDTRTRRSELPSTQQTIRRAQTLPSHEFNAQVLHPRNPYINPPQPSVDRTSNATVLTAPALRPRIPPPNPRSRRDAATQLRSQPSLPALPAQPPTNPWYAANRYSSIEPRSSLHGLNRRTDPQPSGPSPNTPCTACASNSLRCDRSTSFPCPPCSFCTRHGLVCASPTSQLYAGQRDMLITDLPVVPSSSHDNPYLASRQGRGVDVDVEQMREQQVEHERKERGREIEVLRGRIENMLRLDGVRKD